MSLRLKILADLQSTPIPISTPDLIAIHATGMVNGRQKVWHAVRYLERQGLARKVEAKSTGTKWTGAKQETPCSSN